MAKTYREVEELTDQTAKDITNSPQMWMNYLDTAARMYKYSFQEQLLIHAQKPNATACASFALWNSRFHRVVKRGTQGIALIDQSSEIPRLNYVFDVGDTVKRIDGKNPYLWKIPPVAEHLLVERLAERFDTQAEMLTLDSFLHHLAMDAVDSFAEDAVSELRDHRADSFLEDLDDDNLKVRFGLLANASLEYILLSRCGIYPKDYLNGDDFRGITEFNTVETLTLLGNTVAENAESILTVIGQISKQMQIELHRNQQEKKAQITLDNRSNDNYNALKRESEKRTDEPEQGGQQDGTDLPRGSRWDAVSEPDHSGDGGSKTSGQVWETAPEVSDGEQIEPISGNVTHGQVVEPPVGSGRERAGDGGQNYSADGRTTGRDGADESREPALVGAEDEQYHAGSTGSGAERPDLPVSEPEPNIPEIRPDGPELSGLDVFPEVLDEYHRSELEQLLRLDSKNDYLLTEPDVVAEQRQDIQDVVEKPVPTVEKEQVIPAAEMDIPVEPVTVHRTWEPKEKTERLNFQITDNQLGVGGPKEKFRRNLAAINLAHQLEKEKRNAVAEEQAVLAQYVGWGGIPQAFDERASGWSGEYQQLKNALTPEEYAAARGSTLNAHYTSPVVIREMYAGLERMGFTGGNILEPAMGIGNFFGMLPESLSGSSRLYGVELDAITGKIAKQLYQNADVAITGFEKTNFSNDFFDVVIGNVPFGAYQVADKQYDRYHFMIHDYFLAKSLDKVRPGGVVAVITSSGTMDKKNETPRRYLAERADLLGAVRLPNNAFQANAGTRVVTDILFLQKREAPHAELPDWVHLGENQQGYTTNCYFVQHPDMVLGEWTEENTQYGKLEATVKPIEGADLGRQLHEAIGKIEGRIELTVQEAEDLEDKVVSIPADPNVRNFSYAVMDNTIYFRENSVMVQQSQLSAATAERIKGMVAIRDCTRELIDYQLNEYSDEEITAAQQKLNALYDGYTKKYGLLSASANKRAFENDSSYCLLRSLEVLDNEGNLSRKADMFSKRTIKKAETVDHVETASEALAVSIAERAGVDLEFMAKLTGRTSDDVKQELSGVIFCDPSNDRWQTADEYLSGNVREKLRIAEGFLEGHPEFRSNAEALRRVQPKDLTASEIEIRLGATWIKPEYISQFMGELLHTPWYLLDRNIKVQYSKVSGAWNISGKNADSVRNVYVHKVYGTQAANGYRLLEDCLNLRDTRILRKVMIDGGEKTELDAKATMLVQQKQDAIREEFKNWIFKDPQRRADLVREYNERFNSIRPRQYDGSHIRFSGMNPEIKLREHQLNAVAHILYGENTLLAHCVGAGKTYEMAAAAMESKRLGLCRKSLFVVPNSLTEQWASEFLQLYPGANILTATRKDFQPANRKAFCARIATGEWDAVIIGHSQFEKIPLSLERQKRQLEEQIEELVESIGDAKRNQGSNFTIKQLEKTRKSLQAKLEKLNDQSRKDDVVTFEQLGCDRLFVDEAHAYKNCFLYTKMRNIAGIGQAEAKKSSDMLAKCKYMDELTGGKGITFATGTPISNSMTEMYVLMRYLQNSSLKRMELGHFDAWAANFGEAVTALELSPEGSGYRMKTRFNRFFNLPELISVFKEAADVQTADMLELPVPKAIYEDVVLEPSDEQRGMVAALGERAEQVRKGAVEPTQDNMLRITSDGRKLALDQRLINDMLPENPNSKVNACAERVFQIWQEGMEKRTTQMVFSDMSTPKGDGKFNVYDDLKNKLTARGIPPEQVEFIHNADSEAKRLALFAKVRNGDVRVLIGSTDKCGTGTNVQERLIALHHLDVTWKPSGIEQREGRIIRQGNTNPQVKIFRYVTKSSFDAYNWQLLEQKQKFIGQIMTSKSPVRSAEDIDESALSYAEVKALASGNPEIKEKMELDNDVARLKLIKANFQSGVYQMQDDISINFPKRIAAVQEQIKALESDVADAKAIPVIVDDKGKEQIEITIGGKTFHDKKEAGLAIVAACAGLKEIKTGEEIGSYGTFKLRVAFDSFSSQFKMNIQGRANRVVDISKDPYANVRRIQAAVENIPNVLQSSKQQLITLHQQLENAKIEVNKPFPKEAELQAKLERLSQLNRQLDIGNSNSERKNSDIIADCTCKPSIRARLKNTQNQKQNLPALDKHRKQEQMI